MRFSIAEEGRRGVGTRRHTLAHMAWPHAAWDPRLTPLLLPYSHGSAVRGVDETPGEGAPYQAAPHWPRGRRQGQYSEVRRRRRWRGRPGEKSPQVAAKEQLCNLYSQKGRNRIIFTEVLPKGCIRPCLCPSSFIGFPSVARTSISQSQLRSSVSLGHSPVQTDHAGRPVVRGFCYPLDLLTRMFKQYFCYCGH